MANPHLPRFGYEYTRHKARVVACAVRIACAARCYPS